MQASSKVVFNTLALSSWSLASLRWLNRLTYAWLFQMGVFFISLAPDHSNKQHYLFFCIYMHSIFVRGTGLRPENAYLYFSVEMLHQLAHTIPLPQCSSKTVRWTEWKTIEDSFCSEKGQQQEKSPGPAEKGAVFLFSSLLRGPYWFVLICIHCRILNHCLPL